MGFWRNVGYFLSVIMVICGFILFPIGLIGSTIGFIFIWMLKKSARDERMEKHLKKIAEDKE